MIKTKIKILKTMQIFINRSFLYWLEEDSDFSTKMTRIEFMKFKKGMKKYLETWFDDEWDDSRLDVTKKEIKSALTELSELRVGSSYDNIEIFIV